MRYVIARYVEYQREMAYRIFVTDALYEDAEHMRIIPQERYVEKIQPHKIEKRSGEEIAQEVIAKAGLVVKK